MILAAVHRAEGIVEKCEIVLRESTDNEDGDKPRMSQKNARYRRPLRASGVDVHRLFRQKSHYNQIASSEYRQNALASCI